MSTEKLKKVSPEEAQATEADKQEARNAVRQGRALPTIRFAIEDGGDMLKSLRKAIKKMDKDQRESFKDGTESIIEVLQSDMKVSEAKMSWLEKNPVAQLFIGLVLGVSLGAAIGDGDSPVTLLLMASVGVPIVSILVDSINHANVQEREAILRRAKLANKLLRQV